MSMKPISSPWTTVVTSFKVAALVSLLGAVVLAAEQRSGTEIYPEQALAAASVLSGTSIADSVQQPASDYFLAEFPALSGPAAELPPRF